MKSSAFLITQILINLVSLQSTKQHGQPQGIREESCCVEGSSIKHDIYGNLFVHIELRNKNNNTVEKLSDISYINNVFPILNYYTHFLLQ
ncbi:unnamed protein product [Callosobruchus maculatus]|uniref:Uncharacterized protein n=1 Tax=Callosobruchus maculatus TaxID=64391 RepID=A0A653BYZ0_CALMS|nr:unnamed protein product [Callosobruchus maculatus]